MSLKDLFDKGHSLKFLKNKSQNDLAKDFEKENLMFLICENNIESIF
mgnify:CR=1 FL=1